MNHSKSEIVKPWTLNVKTITGNSFQIYVLSTDTVLDVKEEIEKVREIPTDAQILIYLSEVLTDFQVMNEIPNLQSHCTLNLTIKMVDGPLSFRSAASLNSVPIASTFGMYKLICKRNGKLYSMEVSIVNGKCVLRKITRLTGFLETGSTSETSSEKGYEREESEKLSERLSLRAESSERLSVKSAKSSVKSARLTLRAPDDPEPAPLAPSEPDQQISMPLSRVPIKEPKTLRDSSSTLSLEDSFNNYLNGPVIEEIEDSEQRIEAQVRKLEEESKFLEAEANRLEQECRMLELATKALQQNKDNSQSDSALNHSLSSLPGIKSDSSNSNLNYSYQSEKADKSPKLQMKKSRPNTSKTSPKTAQKQMIKLPPIPTSLNAFGHPVCDQCKRKLRVTKVFKCKCGHNFCDSHRFNDQHNCSFDFKSHGREKLLKENPQIRSEKFTSW